VTHLGQRLSALIDGELEGSERERVLVHMARCGSCRDEVAALRMLKRRMNALGEAAAGAGLTGRLMRLSNVMGLDDAGLPSDMPSREMIWPPPPPAGGWPVHQRPSEDAKPAEHHGRPDQRAGRYFLAGSVAIFLAGLGTAAVIAGGEPQARAPAPPVTPSVDVLVAPRPAESQAPPTGENGPPLLLWSRAEYERNGPAVDATSLPGRP
jgi:anti-sigma factor RsiW